MSKTRSIIDIKNNTKLKIISNIGGHFYKLGTIVRKATPNKQSHIYDRFGCSVYGSLCVDDNFENWYVFDGEFKVMTKKKLYKYEINS